MSQPSLNVIRHDRFGATGTLNTSLEQLFATRVTAASAEPLGRPQRERWCRGSPEAHLGHKGAQRRRPCRRVVSGQRIMQSASDIFLGSSSAQGHHCYVRQLRDVTGSAPSEARHTGCRPEALAHADTVASSSASVEVETPIPSNWSGFSAIPCRCAAERDGESRDTPNWLAHDLRPFLPVRDERPSQSTILTDEGASRASHSR